MPVVVMNSLSAELRFTTLVSPVTIETPAAAAAAAIDATTSRQFLHRQALLHDERGGKTERPGAAHRQVVHRSVDGQFADVAAGKKQRRHHERIGGEGDARAARPRAPPGRPACAEDGLSKAGRNRSRTSCAVSLPPLPWPITIVLWCDQRQRDTRAQSFAPLLHAAGTHASSFDRHQMPAVVVIGRARAFGRNHRGAQRSLRRALRAERRTIVRLLQPLQHLAADANLRLAACGCSPPRRCGRRRNRGTRSSACSRSWE